MLVAGYPVHVGLAALCVCLENNRSSVLLCKVLLDYHSV